MAKKRHVVVTTDKSRRGVFFGVLVSHDGDVVVLKNAQMAVYWPVEVHGVVGLAATGPLKGSRISPPIPRIELNGITSIMDASVEAVACWEAKPWN